MCQSMFCYIPFPCKVWDEDARDLMLPMLPFVGLEMGLIWAAAAWLLRWAGLPPLIVGFVLAILPFLMTGFIHLDGYMDVTDAVRSCRDLEKRRAILKDSHVGSFAVIGMIFLALGQFAVLASLPENANVWLLAFIPALSRCGSALAVLILPPMSTSQYAKREKNWKHIWFLIGAAVVLLTAAFLVCGLEALALLGVVLGYGLALRYGYKNLGGMNGDIAGYSLTCAEFLGLLFWVL